MTTGAIAIRVFRVLAVLLVMACSSALATELPFAQPRPGLYSTGQPGELQLQAAAAAGINTVIDLRAVDEHRGFDEAPAVTRSGMRYVSLPIADAADVDDENARVLHQMLAQASEPVLVHCASGNRAGALLALMHARVEDAGIEQALAFGRAAGMTSLEPVIRGVLEQQPDE